MPTLAELRAQSGPKPLPKKSVTVTLVEGQHLLAQSQQLDEELLDLRVQAEVDQAKGDEEGRDRTRKAGQKKNDSEDPRVEEIRAEQRAVVDQLAEFQATLALTGLTGGAWQRYKDEHPPREDNEADLRLTRSLCNSSDLFANLGRFVVAWEGEELADGDWDGWLSERICYADRRDLVTEVVDMHESRLPRAPKSRSSSSSTRGSETD